MLGSRDRATRDYFEITLDYENPTTGEPHIHYFTDDRGQATAFIYTVAELIGVDYKLDFFEWSEDLGSPNICSACNKARNAYHQKLTRELAPQRSVSAMRPPDV
jgi:hypothetical protein